MRFARMTSRCLVPARQVCNMGANEFLVFRAPEIRDRMSNLVENLTLDDRVRRFYLRDPIGVIRRSVFSDEPVPAAEISRGNRLLYGLLSNQKFLDWAEEYEQRTMEKAVRATQIEDPSTALSTYLTVVDRSAIHADLVSAASDFADAEFLAAITWRPDRVGPPIDADVAVDVETFVYAVAAVAVFAVAVAAVFVGARVPLNQQILSRQDILQASRELSTAMNERAVELRDSGKLLDFSRRNTGFIR